MALPGRVEGLYGGGKYLRLAGISGMWEAPQVPKPKIRGCFVAVRHLKCLPHSGGSLPYS